MMSELPADCIPVSDAELALLVRRLEWQINRANALLDKVAQFKDCELVIKGTRDGLLDLAAKAMKGAVEAATIQAEETTPAPPAIHDSASLHEITPLQVRIVRDDDLRRRLEERAMRMEINLSGYFAALKYASVLFFGLFFVSAAVGLVTIVRWLVHFITG